MSEDNERPSPGKSDAEELAPTSTSGRKHQRFGIETEITLESDHNFYAGFVENLSVSGIFVATHVPRKIGELVEFSIRLGKAEEPVKGVGEVRWLRQYSETSDAPPGMGLRFIQLEEQARRRIDSFLESRNPLFFDDVDD